jgi:nucleotide-binding universal stress UspA family protein
VCAYSGLSRRDEAKNVSTIGGDARTGQVLGRQSASAAIADAVAVAQEEGAAISAALMLEGDAAKALLATAAERSADLVVLGAVQDRSLADRLLGTVALEVAKRVGCDVLIVRPEHGEAEFEVPEEA